MGRLLYSQRRLSEVLEGVGIDLPHVLGVTAEVPHRVADELAVYRHGLEVQRRHRPHVAAPDERPVLTIERASDAVEGERLRQLTRLAVVGLRVGQRGKGGAGHGLRRLAGVLDH